MRPNVPIEHGITTMPSCGFEPEAMAAPTLRGLKTCTRSNAASLSKSCATSTECALSLIPVSAASATHAGSLMTSEMRACVVANLCKSRKA